MVDFLKKIRNSDKFRSASLTFISTGLYCSYPTGSTEYFQFWDEEARRCLDGYTADDGDYITGYNYFYLNYCPIDRIVYEEVTDRFGVTKLVRKKKLFFPDFYDYDYYFYWAVLEAEDNGKHMCVLKSRRKGYSFKCAAMCCRNYYFIRNSKSYVYVSNKQYLTEDGILNKAWSYLDFIDKNTAWGKKRQVFDQMMHKRASFKEKDEYGNEVEVGFKSEIIGVSLKDNPGAVRGKAGKLILFEEAGSFPNLAAAWQVARPSVEQDGIAYGLMLSFGTGGDEGSSFASLKDMFYNPKGYNCLEFENIWDEAVEAGSKCGFFIPLYTNLDVRDNDNNRLYMDEDGNTLHKKAMDYVLSLRREVIENATSQLAVDRYVAEQPITPREACLEFTGNIFPKKELQNHLAFIRTHKNVQAHKLVGELVFDHDGNIQWDMKKHGDITKYPLGKNDDPTGAIVIWEHPVKDAPNGLYIAGLDSYDYDQSGTNSLGSCIIYKRFLNFEEYYDLPVAEYTGRPATADMFYENVRKLLLYYNAKCLYENQNKGFFTYMTQKHCDYMLADLPDILADIIGNSTVQRKKGCHMNKLIKAWGEGKIKDWLNEEYAPGKKNLTKILSEPLLEELISYNDLGNFDRCVTKGTLITTSRGDIPVEDVFVGDKVLTHTGQYKDVTWTDAHIHTGNIVTLKAVGDYQTLRCTDNHPIYTAYTTKKKHKYRKDSLQTKEFLRADQLTNKYLFTLLPTRKNLENINLSQGMLYVLGWIMADGYCASNGYTVRITFQKGQDLCAEQCKLHIEEYLSDEEWYYTRRGRRFKRKPTRIEDCGTYLRLTVASKKLHTLALRFGCKPNDKKIADDIYNRYGNLMPFVLGWLEGDGHQRHNVSYDGYSRNGIELATIYEDLARQCRQIMLDNGIYSSIREIKPRNGKRQVGILISNEYVQYVLNKYSEDYGLISYKFKPTVMRKNTSKVLHDSEGFWVPIKVVDTLSVSEQVYNFEVADDHTYIANAITTHNCMAFMQIIIYREQLFNVVVKLREEVNKSRLLFDGPIFTNEWFNDSSYDTNDNIPVFTF